MVGGTTVALTLMLGSIDLRREVCIALSALYLLLFFSSGYLLGGLQAIGLRPPGVVDRGLQWAGLVIMGLVIAFASAASGEFPLKATTSHWWYFIGITLFAAVVGEVQRRFAESALEDLSDIGKVRPR